MNSSGIIRRVDELGRVVIPVEIRRYLNIKEGENLEFIIKESSIELKKKSMIDGNTSFFDQITDKLNEIIEGHYLLCDRNRVYKTNDELLLNKAVPVELSNLLSVHDVTSLKSMTLIFDDVKLVKDFYIFPYYSESDIAGLIVLYDINNIGAYNLLMKFITSYIHDKLSL